MLHQKLKGGKTERIELDDVVDFTAPGISLTQFNINADFREAEPCKAFSRFAGRGDVVPLLDMPALDEERQL